MSFIGGIVLHGRDSVSSMLLDLAGLHFVTDKKSSVTVGSSDSTIHNYSLPELAESLDKKVNYFLITPTDVNDRLHVPAKNLYYSAAIGGTMYVRKGRPLIAPSGLDLCRMVSEPTPDYGKYLEDKPTYSELLHSKVLARAEGDYTLGLFCIGPKSSFALASMCERIPQIFWVSDKHSSTLMFTNSEATKWQVMERLGPSFTFIDVYQVKRRLVVLNPTFISSKWKKSIPYLVRSPLATVNMVQQLVSNSAIKI